MTVSNFRTVFSTYMRDEALTPDYLTYCSLHSETISNIHYYKTLDQVDAVNAEREQKSQIIKLELKRQRVKHSKALALEPYGTQRNFTIPDLPTVLAAGGISHKRSPKKGDLVEAVNRSNTFLNRDQGKRSLPAIESIEVSMMYLSKLKS